MIKNEYGIIAELGGFTIPGSNKFFKTFEEAYAYASQYGRTKRTRAIDKLANIKITYDDIYDGGESHGFITAIDTIDYNGNTFGGGFYQAFSDIWTNGTSPTGDYHTAYRTLGWLFSHRGVEDYEGVESLIQKIKEETTEAKDPVLNYALEVLDNLSDDYWQNNTFEE